ncbi:MAG: hypothetical protein WC441_04145 [Patescibacteria group bacterium]
MFTAPVASGQTRQENRQIAHIEGEITRLQNQANRLENSMEDTSSTIMVESKLMALIAKLQADTANPKDVTSQLKSIRELKKLSSLLNETRKSKAEQVRNNRAVASQLTGLYSRIAQLEQNRKAIFDRYTNTTGIPREMTQNTMKRRLQANVIRREESSINVLEHLPIYGTMVDSTIMLKVVIDNQAIGMVSFQFKPLNGGLSQSIAVPAKTRMEITLVPGNYLVVTEYRSTLRAINLTVGRVVQNYAGIACHGYVFYPPY